jgi:ABC-type dipeptide/oligopeptide/nickel transport system permease component
MRDDRRRTVRGGALPGRFVLRRVALAVPTLAGILVAVFVLIRLVPGDPVAMMVGPGATAQDVARLRALYGLDRPLPTQLALYLGDVTSGRLGTSISLKQPVVELVAGRLPFTLELGTLALLAAVALGASAAVGTALRPGSTVARLLDTLTGAVGAVPDFLWALVGILALGVAWPVLPVFGLLDPALQFTPRHGFYLSESLLGGHWAVAASLLRHLALPALALALPLAAMIARVLRASLIEALEQDYILVARARGLSPLRVLVHEALRNAVVPTLALTGAQFTFVLGGTVLVEKLFGLPGIGNLAIDAVVNRDLPLIQGVVLAFGTVFLCTNLLVDLAASGLDPRLGAGA